MYANDDVDGIHYFVKLSGKILSDLVESYVTRQFNEDVAKLEELVGPGEQVMDRLCMMLHTSKETGISTEDEWSLMAREAVFGNNSVPRRKPTSFSTLIYNASKDFVLRILMVSGFVSLILSFVSDGDKRIEWVDGVAIFLAVIIVLLVTACNDYLKERQFAALSETSEKLCTVIRDGKTVRMSTEKLLVGDILFVEIGDELPADSVVLSAQQLELDESSMTGESDSIKKASYDECVRMSATFNAKELQKTSKRSIVMDGTGVLLVIAVGHHSRGGQLLNKLALDTAPTSLQNKLNTLARDIGMVGFVAAVATFCIYVIQFWINYKIDEDFRDSLSFKAILNRHLKFLVQAITILVVAVPEGLPLAVTLSLAFSIRRLLRDQNYVRRLAACETMGSASEVLLDKTGTLTMNRMTVGLIWTAIPSCNAGDGSLLSAEHFVAHQPPKSQPDNAPLQTSCDKTYLAILVQGIAVNSTANLEITDTKTFNATVESIKIVGSPTESALLLFLRSMQYNYEQLRSEYGGDGKIVYRIPFSSSRKLMTTVVRHPENPHLYRAYVKGGAELVFGLCSSVLETSGKVKSLNAPKRNLILRRVIQHMTCQGLRVVCLAYKEFDPTVNTNWNQVVDVTDSRYPFSTPYKQSNFLSEAPTPLDNLIYIDLHDMELELTCVAILGIQDPVRAEVPAAVRRCQQAGIRVRMVTGDNIETAKQIAIKCNIHHPEKGGLALTGAEFYRQIGGVVCSVCRTEICDCPFYEESEKIPNKFTEFQMERRKTLKRLGTADLFPQRSLNQTVVAPPHLVKEKSCFSIQLDTGDERPVPREAASKTCVPWKLLSTCFRLTQPIKKNIRILKPARVLRVDVINNLSEFSKIIRNLEVLARSQPQDKYAMVLGLKSLGEIVAVTGDGTNDAPALKKADVGFAMGIAGKDVAKQAADIVILDDNFESIVKAIKWGRSIYKNVQKFLLFQLTVNIVAVIIALVGSIVIGESPLNAVQLLWVNLIMDSFASLALATAPATDDLLDQPHSRNEYLITRLMTRNILGQAIYQLTVMFLLIFTGECWIPEQVSSYQMFEGVNRFSQFSKTCGNGRTVAPGRRFYPFSQKELYLRSWTLSIGPSRHYTVVFNTFVWLQLMNLWNARRVDNEWNIFSRALSSSLWWIIIGIISCTQFILIQFGGHALNSHTQGLTVIQWLMCIGFGCGGLVVGFLLHFIPAEQLLFIPQAGNKETDILAESTNVALASRGRFSTDRLSSRLAAGLLNEPLPISSRVSNCPPKNRLSTGFLHHYSEAPPRAKPFPFSSTPEFRCTVSREKA